jgi:putative membrane protein
MRRLPWVLAAATVAGQILWILASPQGRVVLTIATVTTFLLASASHAALHRGLRWAGGYLAIAGGLGWLAEAIGTGTGQPFGTYSYSELLGWRLGAVPLVIPMAWAMMAYPCLLAAQVLAGSRVRAVLVGGWLFASWDLFLDPQMVGEGYWRWHGVGAALPGIDEIPIHNFLGWLLVAVILMTALTALPAARADDRVPNILLSWTYVGSTLAAAVFLGRPAVAAWGAVAMGVVVIPWWFRLARGGAPPAATSPAAVESRGSLK